MSPELSSIFTIAIFTTALLGIGAGAGYFAGRRESGQRLVSQTAVREHGRTPRQPDWSADLAHCVTQSRHVAGLSQQLIVLAAAQPSHTPPELKDAIQRLNGVSQALAQHWNRLAREGQAGLPQPFEERAAAAKSNVRSVCLPLPGFVSPGLTPAEIIAFTGATMSDSPAEVSQQRYPYHCLQMVAPWRDLDEAPADATEVRCHDISVEGISFYWPDKPDFDHVMISLGQRSRTSLMAAEVRQSKAVFKHGQVQYLVGCRFLRRVETSPLPLAAAAM